MFKENRNYFIYFILLFLSITIMAIDLSKGFEIYSNELNDFLIYIYGFTPYMSNNVIMQLLYASISNLIIVGIFSTIVSSDIKKNSQYLFTRTSKREKWLSLKFKNIAIEIFFIITTQLIFSIILSLIFGYSFSNIKNTFITIFLILYKQFICIYTLVIISNLFSLFFSDIYGYSITVIIFISNLLVIPYMYLFSSNLIKYLPFSQQLLLLQNIKLINKDILVYPIQLNNFSLIYSTIYSILIIVILTYIGMKIIKSYEFY